MHPNSQISRQFLVWLVLLFNVSMGYQILQRETFLTRLQSSSGTNVTPRMLPLRIGHGYDIHRLSDRPGGRLVIGGVIIPHTKGTEAHSDGDAVYHSVVDAILGALCMPDIGQLFPDNDPQWRGVDSSIFMKEAYKVMTSRGYRIGNLDVTLILQAPKVKDLKVKMRANIAGLLDTSEDRVNVKARTHEEVDSVGEGRAYECHVVVLLEKNNIGQE